MMIIIKTNVVFMQFMHKHILLAIIFTFKSFYISKFTHINGHIIFSL